jgi:urease accessory protein
LALARTVAIDGVLCACSKVDGVLVCRAVGMQSDAVRKALVAIWQLIRPQVAGRAAVPPRIWAT